MHRDKQQIGDNDGIRRASRMMYEGPRRGELESCLELDSAHQKVVAAALRTQRLLHLGIAILVAAFLVAFNPTCSRAANQAATAVVDFVRSFLPAERAADAPGALLVSRKQADKAGVTSVLEPRGVRVLFADNIALGLEYLNTAKTRIGLLVVDDALPLSSSLVREAKSKFPDISVLVLKGPRAPATIASNLLNYVPR